MSKARPRSTPLHAGTDKGWPQKPAPRTIRLLLRMALAEAAGMRMPDLERMLPPSQQSTSTTRNSAKSVRPQPYQIMLAQASLVLPKIMAFSMPDSPHCGEAHKMQVPLWVYNRVYCVANRMATALLTTEKAIKAEKLHRVKFYKLLRKYPVVWRSIWERLAFGWAGPEGQAPRKWLNRARMRKAAWWVAVGLSGSAAARRMELPPTCLHPLMEGYPVYWKFLCEQSRREIGLAPGERQVAMVLDEKGRKITYLPHGASGRAIAKLRKASGVHLYHGPLGPLSEGRLKKTPGAGDQTWPPRGVKLLSKAAVLHLYDVSSRTLKRDRESGLLTGHRRSGAKSNSPFYYDETQIARLYTLKKRTPPRASETP